MVHETDNSVNFNIKKHKTDNKSRFDLLSNSHFYVNFDAKC